MDDLEGDLNSYWDGDIFLRAEEIDSWGLDEALLSYYDSSSPDSSASTNIVTERNRRRKLNERLFALRAVVPNITKMDKASIMKDAINYIQELLEQERILQAEIEDLESDPPILIGPKKRKTEQNGNNGGSASPIEILDLSVTFMGEKTMVVSLTCEKRKETVVKMCEVFEAIKLKVITTSIMAESARVTKTLFIEAEEEDKDVIRQQIEMAFAAFNGP